jgi:hypothetical protein
LEEELYHQLNLYRHRHINSLEAGPGGSDLASGLVSRASKGILKSSELGGGGSTGLHSSRLLPSLGVGRRADDTDEVSVVHATVVSRLSGQLGPLSEGEKD